MLINLFRRINNFVLAKFPGGYVTYKRSGVSAGLKLTAQALTALVIVNIIWGIATPVIKYTLQYISPFTFIFLRFTLVCLLILPFTIHLVKKEKVNTKDLPNFFLLGLFSQASLIILFVGIDYSTALESMIIGISATLLAVAAGHYFYNEKINNRIKWGLLLATFGTILVVLEPILVNNASPASTAHRIIGNVLLFLYNITWVLYVIWSKYSMGERSKLLKKTLSFVHLKPMTKTYSPSLIALASFFVGLAASTPLALLEQFGVIGGNATDISKINVGGWLGLLYMALFSSIVAYLLNQWAMEHAKVSDISLFSYMAPIFAVPAAYLLLGEIPDTFMIIGGLLIATGVMFAENPDN